MSARRRKSHPSDESASGPARPWRPWAAGLVTLALLLTGGAVFAGRAGYLDALPGIGPPELKNRLAGATSPYLRSAAEQPVAWQPWGPKAFELARRLDRPIWLDIGAIWCHWCHVMDRESYENPGISALINENFVPVKVDRDERPDIDERYQAAHRALNGRAGGWPLTMFLTPEGIPFAGGTYFPPDVRGGSPGLRQIAPRAAALYHEQRERVQDVAGQVRDYIASANANPGVAGELTSQLVETIARKLASSFDPEYGGLGTGPGSKFPNGEAIRLALALGFLGGDAALERAALETLDAYARSGMRDHVNGGFFRYSVNRQLTIPHFEKMDYVQAALLIAYLDAYRRSGEAIYAEVARDIMRYVDATLSDRERGGFYAHQDADVSLDDDGSYYTWSLAQLAAAIPEGLADAVRLRFGVEAAGEMAEDPAQNVLRIVRTQAEIARELGISEAEARRRAEAGTRALAQARRGDAPFVERTKFTNRNGMMIAAYLDAYEALGDTTARNFALNSLDFLLARAVKRDGHVYHAVAGGAGYVDGLMADYAALTDALLHGYLASGRGAYLSAAETVMDRAVEIFWDEKAGGFFDRPLDPSAPALLADRAKDFTDTPLPGDNAVAARALEKLYLISGRERWRELAERTLTGFAGTAASYGSFVATYALAAEIHIHKAPQAVIIGPRRDERTEKLAAAAWRAYRPGRMVATYDPNTVALDSLPPAVAGAARVYRSDPTPRAYVCVGQTCAPPTSSPAEVAALVRDYGRVGVR